MKFSKLFLVFLFIYMTLSFHAQSIIPNNSDCCTANISDKDQNFALQKNKNSGFLSGTPNLLVILIDFEDYPADITRDEVDEFMNDRTLESHPETGGFRDYYDKNSYGIFNPKIDVTPWYRAKYTFEKYKEEIGSKVAAEDSLFFEAIEWLDDNPDINLADYDNNWNGRKNSISIIFLTSKIIRAQAFHKLYEKDDLSYWRYCYSSISRSNYNLGTTAHEFGHVLGLPDLYLTKEPIGNYCIMSHAKGDPPGNFCAWSKYQLGWIEPLLIEEASEQVEIPESNTNPFAVKVFNDRFQDGRYFLIENRVQQGYDSPGSGKIQGEGLVIYHVDASFDNEWVRVMQADGLDHLNLWFSSDGSAGNVGDDGDFFPGPSNNRTFNFMSNPSSANFFGEDEGVEILNISNPAQVMYADIHPANTKGTTLRVNPELEYIFKESYSYDPSGRGVENDSVWGGDVYEAKGFDQLEAMTYYYSDRFFYPDEVHTAQKVTLRLYKEFDLSSGVPSDMFYQKRFDVSIPELESTVSGLSLIISGRALIKFDEPIEVPETFFATYCQTNEGRDPMNGRIIKGNINDDVPLVRGDESYYAEGKNFPSFIKSRGYITLHFYASNANGTTSTINPYNDEDIKIYPNPSSDRINIDYRNLDPISVSLINSQGIRLSNGMKSDFSSIQVGEYPTGIYFLKVITTDGQQYLKKVMVIN